MVLFRHRQVDGPGLRHREAETVSNSSVKQLPLTSHVRGSPQIQGMFMNRRKMLTAFAAKAALPVLFSTAAFAQTEKDHRRRRKEARRRDAEGRLAVPCHKPYRCRKRASHPMVKKFARWEVAEQDTIADILRSMEMEGKAEGAFKPASDSEVEAMLDARRARLRFKS